MRITYAGRCTCSAHALAALLAAASVTAREVSPKDAAPCSATMHHHKSIRCAQGNACMQEFLQRAAPAADDDSSEGEPI